MRQVSKTEFVQDNRSASGRSCYPNDWFLERAGVPKIEMMDSLIVPRIDLENVDVISMPTKTKRAVVDASGNNVKDRDGKDVLATIEDPITWNLIVAEHMVFTQPTYTQLKMGSTMVSILSRLEALSDGKTFIFYKSFILLRGRPEDKALSMPVYHDVYLAAVSSYHVESKNKEPPNELVRRADVYMDLFSRLLPELDVMTPGGVHCTHKLLDGSQSSEETSSTSVEASTTDES